MDNDAMFKLSYGLFVLTAKQEDKDNGCIINTAMQVTGNPNQIIIGVNKQNYTHDMIMTTKKFNLSVLDESVTFDIFQHFGFQSGRHVNKFDNIHFKRSPNEVAYLTKGTNAWISGYVTSTVDMGTHTLFIATVVGAKILSNVNSATYTYYHNHIKPTPKKETKKGYRCKICGYIYEGEVLPEDYICPLCKHGASDFEKID